MGDTVCICSMVMSLERTHASLYGMTQTMQLILSIQTL